MSAISSQDAAPLELAVPDPESCSVFIVDDEPQVREFFGRLLRERGYTVREFAAAQDALAALRNERASLLVSDLAMPGMNGIELAQRALREDPDLAVIIITGVPDSVTAAESLRLGVADYLAKPVTPGEFEESVRRTLSRRAELTYHRKLEHWLGTEADRRARALESVTVATLVTLVRAMEAKDPYLKGDSERVAALAEKMAWYLGLDSEESEEVRVAGLLHDIGLISVPESILHKNTKLTDEEFEQVKKHAEVGADILQPLSHLGSAIDYVRYHHERLNGSGYPEGLRGEEIPLGAQIVGLADSYVALVTERPFRPAYSQFEAVQTLKASAGIWFEEQLLEALQQAVIDGARSAGYGSPHGSTMGSVTAH